MKHTVFWTLLECYFFLNLYYIRNIFAIRVRENTISKNICDIKYEQKEKTVLPDWRRRPSTLLQRMLLTVNINFKIVYQRSF